MFNPSSKEILKFLEDNRGKRFEANRKMGVKKTVLSKLGIQHVKIHSFSCSLYGIG